MTHRYNYSPHSIDNKFLHYLFLAPVVITSQTHQPVGAPHAYPVAGVQSNYQANVMPPGMPMPYNDNSTTYPIGQPQFQPGPAPYPSVPYGQQPMYPPVGGSAPYPSQAAPYPPQAMMQPPTYNEVVGPENYQKQSAFNPNFSG